LFAHIEIYIYIDTCIINIQNCYLIANANQFGDDDDDDDDDGEK